VSNGIFAIPIKRLEPTAEEQMELFGNSARTVPENSLQQFIFGRENTPVRQALECVLAQQSIASPLVFYGASGTGKTVLSHTLIAQWFQRYPEQKTLHTTGADFARMHARAVYTHSINDFHKKFLGVSLLVIDDLQVLKTRTSAQQMLCNLIDFYQANDRMMVVCLPELPTRLSGIDERLCSRLMGGLQIELKPPGHSAREVIVDQLAEQHGVELDPPARESLIKPISPIGDHIDTVPKIRQTLIRLRSEAELTALDISESDIEKLLHRQKTVARPDIKAIATAVGKHLNIRLNEIKSSSRRRYVVRARGIAIYLCRQFTASSFGDIGHYFGRRDHSTAIHAFKKTASLLKTDASISQAIVEIKDALARKYNLEAEI